MNDNKRYTLYLAALGALVLVVSIILMTQLYQQSESSHSTGKNLEVVIPVIEKNTSVKSSSAPQEPTTRTSSNSRSSAPANDSTIISETTEEKTISGGSGGGGGSGGSSGNNQNQDTAPTTNTDPINNQQNQPNIPVSGSVCNPSLLTHDGLDPSRIIDIATCNLLNTLYTSGAAAGNAGDTYYNLDNKHVNLCIDWTPNPDCPEQYRLFAQHAWQFSGQGRVTSPFSSITVGQASYGGAGSHGIAYVYYQNQHNAEEAYRLYTHNNLYVYPSLDDDGYLGAKHSIDTMNSPVLDSAKANIANTPYIISSKQITKPGTDYYMIHDASGSEFPFVKLALVALAAFKPEVKQKLAQQINAQGVTATFLIPTIQMLIRYSHKTVNNNQDYLSNTKIHAGAYLAHDFVNGVPQPAYDAAKLLTMANSLTLSDIPPLVQLRVISGNFDQSEKLFDTPGAIARSVPYNSATKTITVNAQNSFDIEGKTDNMEYVWKTLDNSPNVKITVNSQNPAEATIEFSPVATTQRMDVFVFVKKSGGKYYSVPGVISQYVHN